MKLDLNGCTLTLCDVERIIATLERDGRIEVVNCRKDLGGATLLRLGAYLARIRSWLYWIKIRGE